MMTAMPALPRSARYRRSSVVLPLPRNPDRTVTARRPVWVMCWTPLHAHQDRLAAGEGLGAGSVASSSWPGTGPAICAPAAGVDGRDTPGHDGGSEDLALP